MPRCFFVSDLHGQVSRYRKLSGATIAERPDALFLGGDLLPAGAPSASHLQGAGDFLLRWLSLLREEMGETFPRVFVIMGNDDRRADEATLREGERLGLLEYIHERKASLGRFDVYGYACVPPTPFLLKDWERYDVSRYVDPGCVSPEEGFRSVPVPEDDRKYATIKTDLARLAGDAALELAIFLFHASPHRTSLDRAALDGASIDGVQLDVHVGSIAIRRFIEERQPLLTLHGHVHESARLSHAWRDRIGRTHLLSAAHDGLELALIRFDPEGPDKATRELI